MNPPSRNFRGHFRKKKIDKNLHVIDYKLHIPGRIKKYFPFIYFLYMKSRVRLISERLYNSIDITIDFSSDLMIANKKSNYFHAQKNIFFIVDMPSANYRINSNKISDFYLATTSTFIDLINLGGKNFHVLGHSVSNDFLKFKPEKNKNNNVIKIGHVGSLFTHFINYDLLHCLVKKFDHIEFHFIGPYVLKNKKNNLGFSKDNSENIQKLLEQKNTIFYGMKNKEDIMNISKQFDAMLVCYHEYGSHPLTTNNPHKVLEYLAMGKVIISNFLKDYDKYNKKIIYMPKKNHSLDDYIKNFHNVIQNIDKHNDPDLVKKRIQFASKRSYKNNSKKLLKEIGL